MADPFTLVHDAIWDCMEANTAFAALVPVGNRMYLTGSKRHPFKTNATTNDRPSVVVIPVGGPPTELITTDGQTVTQSYEVQILTDTLVVGGTDHEKTIYNVGWEAYRGLLLWKQIIKPLTIGDKNDVSREFVTSVDFEGFEQGVVNPAIANTRGVGGVNTFFTITVHMYFSNSAFVPDYTP